MKKLITLWKQIPHPFALVPPIFYMWTACRTIGFGDTALMVDAIKRGLVDAQVNTHPLTVMTGMLFQNIPWGNYAFRATLVSVFYGSLTVLTFYLVVLEELE